MSIRLLAAGAAALMLTAAPLFPHAQPAASPAAMAEPAPAPAAASARAVRADRSDGKVAYYGRKFAGRTTASGERFDPAAMTMAHKTLPFGSHVRVTNLKNHKSVVVRVNDRGPSGPGLVGDLTSAAAGRIGMLHAGIADVRLQVVGSGKAHKAAHARRAHRA